MIAEIKKHLYFPVAWYFRFFAQIRLWRWRPRVVVATGSNGKTTLLHLLEAQIGNRARYSHHANSSYGIPFDILDLHRKSLFKSEWIRLFFLAPLRAFSPVHKEDIYIVEADVDRPGEGEFLASFLKPEVVLWVSTSKTHSMNFDHLVMKRLEESRTGLPRSFFARNDKRRFADVEEAIAYEFGFFAEYCQKLILINGDLPLEVEQMKRTKAKVDIITKRIHLVSYEVGGKGTRFQIDGRNYSFKALLPEDIFYSIMMCRKTVEYLGLQFDKTFSKFVLPPGRSSIFQGIKGITIIDSTYNATPASVSSILKMFEAYQVRNKWLILGDMIELGSSEQEEHEKLAELLMASCAERIILMGIRVSMFTYLKLIQNRKNYVVEKFEKPREALDYLLSNLQGGETILFKGVRFMEGIIENLLLDKKDVAKLARREGIWEKRRKEWGL